MNTGRPSLRIVPTKATALFQTLLFAALLVIFSNILFQDIGSMTVNGQEVHGVERQRFRLMSSFFLILPFAGMLWYGRRLLPGSPFDFLEIGPQGLTVGTLFGRRHRRWEEISGFSVGNIPLTNPPIIWVKVQSERPIRFFMGGYVRYKLFSWTSTRVREIAAWLDLVRRVYAFGDGELPPPPNALAGKIIPWIGMERSSSSSVIERRGRG
jgi:hypothetical protein